MALHTLTINVLDFDETTGTPPRNAVVEIARAQVSAVGAVLVSTQPVLISLVAGIGTAQLEGGDAYRLLFRGVRGLERAFFAAMPPADTSAAALWATNQLDPGSLQPLPSYPTVAAAFATLQASVTAILAGAPGQFDTFLEVATQFGLDEATVTALTALVAAKAPLASPTFTGTVSGITAAMVSADPAGTAAAVQAALTAEVSRATAAEGGAAQKSANLSDLPNAATARANLGLGSAATQPVSAFDTAGAAGTVQTNLTTEIARAQAAEALKAPLASPAFTGTPTIAGTAVAKTTDITTAISNLVGAAPLALDTLVEIDAQLAADEGSAAALAAVVATKQTAAQVAALIAAQAASDMATYPALRSTPPDHTVVVAYVDTSGVPPVLKGWNGSAWVALGGSSSPTVLNVTAPTITGTTVTGNVLTVSNGTWSATPDSYGYQWTSDGTPITGATSNTYTLLLADAGHAIDCTVTASKGGYASGAASAAPVTPTAPLNSGAALTAYNTAAQWVENWADESAWTQQGTPSQVSGGLLYGTNAPYPEGVYRALPGGASPLGSGVDLTVTTELIIPAGGPAGYLMALGFDTDTDNASYNGNFVGFGVQVADTSGVVLANTTTTTQVSADTLAAGTYRLTMTIDDLNVSWSLTSADHSVEYTTVLTRPTTITRLSLWVGDTRGLSGTAFGPVTAKLALSPTKPRQTVETYADSVMRTTGTTTMGASQYRIALPASYDPSVGAPLVMFFHPYSGNEMTPWTEANPRGVVNALTAAGFIVAASSGPSQNDWGLQSKLDADYALWQYLYNRYAILKTAFYSESMGGVSGLLGIAANRIPAVAWVGSMAVCNLRAEYDGAYNSAIQFAYGLASDGSDYATKTAGHDPALLAGSAFRGLPMRFYASPSDTNVPKAQNADVLYAKVSGNPNTANIAVTGGHTDPSGFPATDIRDWLLARTA